MDKKTVFWREKNLNEMSLQEWESVCDGCARCCLQKLQDIDTGETFFTRIACRLLDIDTCRCADYENRLQKVADCANVAPLTDEKCKWLPASCAYRRLEEGHGLPAWHHLQSPGQDAVHEAGISIRDWAISENVVSEELYEQLIIDFDDEDRMFRP